MDRRLMIATTAALFAAGGAWAQAGDWPSRPIKLLVGSAPGGGTDAMARAVADRLAPALKVPVVVDNRPGASNTLAADLTAKSTDGATLVMGVSTAHAIAPPCSSSITTTTRTWCRSSSWARCRTCWS